VTAGAIDLAVSFNILADRRSGPLALGGSTVERREVTSSSVQRRSAGKLSGFGAGGQLPIKRR